MTFKKPHICKCIRIVFCLKSDTIDHMSNTLLNFHHRYIPNNAVGAIIGTKGSHIRNIIRFSTASVKIAPLEADKPIEQQPERKVTIIGSPEAQWKAQYLIFEKMREEGFVTGTDDVRLTVEILVPSSQVSIPSYFL